MALNQQDIILSMTAARAARALRCASVLFALGLALHVGDHLRRGLDLLTSEVFWAGNLSTVLAAAAIIVTLAGYHRSATIAIVIGFSQAIGVAAVHLLPRWSVLSDSLPAADADALTWLAVSAEIVGALAFGAAGAYGRIRLGRDATCG